MSATAERPAVFNPLEEGFVESPYDQYRRLRDHDPVHRSELVQAWVITRHDDVGAVLRDPTVSAEIDKATPTPFTESEIERREASARGGRTLVLLDDPDHARLRKLVARPFRPRQVDELRARVEARVSGRLDDLRRERGERAELDIVEDFAYPLPVEVFCEMLGFPEEDNPKFRWWTLCVARSLDPLMDPEEREALLVDIDEMYAYLEEQVEVCRADPGDDILSMLVHAEEDGETLTHEELLAQLMTLYVAGHEPTAGLIGNGLLGLLRQPEQLARLRAEPDLLRNAVSELLRWDGPNQFVRRIATEDLDVSGTVVPAGDVMYLSPASANRDPRRWGADADEIVVDREDAGQHLQFGAGVHACLGTHLARMQAEVALSAIFARLLDLELAGEPEWSQRMVIRGLNRLPVTCTIAP